VGASHGQDGAVPEGGSSPRGVAEKGITRIRRKGRIIGSDRLDGG